MDDPSSLKLKNQFDPKERERERERGLRWMSLKEKKKIKKKKVVCFEKTVF